VSGIWLAPDRASGRRPSSLSDLTLIYCGKADFGHFSSSFLLVAGSSVCDSAKAVLFTAFQVLNRTTIRLKRAQKLPQNGLSLATIGQARQIASLPLQGPLRVNKNDLVEHLPDLRRYARSLLYAPNDAEDLVQETLLSALANMPLWLRRSKRRPWLFSIMHNNFVNLVQQGKTREKHFPSLVSLYGDPVEQPPDEPCAGLHRALQYLSVDDRSLLLLVAQAGFSYEQVAHILDLPLGTVMSRLHRARRKLRKLLEQADDHRYREQQ
jgi:RNA polymerase sigma-70 factor (ECF subfamily)